MVYGTAPNRVWELDNTKYHAAIYEVHVRYADEFKDTLAKMMKIDNQAGDWYTCHDTVTDKIVLMQVTGTDMSRVIAISADTWSSLVKSDVAMFAPVGLEHMGSDIFRIDKGNDYLEINIPIDVLRYLIGHATEIPDVYFEYHGYTPSTSLKTVVEIPDMDAEQLKHLREEYPVAYKVLFTCGDRNDVAAMIEDIKNRYPRISDKPAHMKVHGLVDGKPGM